MNYIDFFKALGNEQPICFADNREIIEIDKISELNKKRNLYFIPNCGGVKGKEITEFRTFFIDLDCGKDENKKYFPLEYVKKYKKEQLAKLKAFVPCPNAIIETRNGYHAYWFIHEMIDFEKWNEVEQYLINTFDADKRVSKPANQLRIPCTWWVKDKANPFFCDVVYFDYVNKPIASYCKSNKKQHEKENLSSKFKYKKAIHQEQKVKIFNSYREIFDYLTKSVSIFDYLKTYYRLAESNPNNFCCILHNDTKPSASIFKTDSGVELYHCHSTNCGFIGNIIQLVAKLEHISRSDAIKKLSLDLNIRYEKDEKTVNMLFDNIAALNDDIEYSHRDLYTLIYRYLPTLRELHYIAIENMYYANTQGGMMFSVSTNYVARRLGRADKKNTGADISLMCLLQLIDKIDLDNEEISDAFKKYIKDFQNGRPKYINIYSIPEYTYDKLSECNSMAKEVKEKNLRKRHFTYESVCNAFGQETADRVFPQVKNKHVRDIDSYLLETIKILLSRDGYFSQKSVMEYYGNENVFFSEATFIKQTPAIVQALDLEKVHTSKQIKEKYNILAKGYPTIYVKKGD